MVPEERLGHTVAEEHLLLPDPEKVSVLAASDGQQMLQFLHSVVVCMHGQLRFGSGKKGTLTKFWKNWKIGSPAGSMGGSVIPVSIS